MSKNWGRTPIVNADKLHRSTNSKYLVETADGETDERIDRRPLGKVERFVDKAGNICNVQLCSDGDPKRRDTEARLRMQAHRKGFVEYSKCPLKHGTRYVDESIKKDFRKLPEALSTECRSDPKVMERRDGDLYAKESCPHIEWLIKTRREQAAADYAKRNAHVAAADKKAKEKADLEALQAELLKKQIAEMQSKKTGKPKDAAE